MKKFLLAALLAGASVSGANATVLNFDNLVGSGVLASNYAGLNFGSEFIYYDTPQSPYTASSPNTRIFSNYAIHGVGLLDSLSLKFTAPAIFSGAFIAGDFFPGVTISGYYLGNLVAVSASLNQTATPTFLSLGYAGNVDEVRFNGYNGYYVIDDITFTGGVGGGVPEPASWAMLIAGFGLVGAAARRRRSVVAA